jgi:hypothetical protein
LLLGTPWENHERSSVRKLRFVVRMVIPGLDMCVILALCAVSFGDVFTVSDRIYFGVAAGIALLVALLGVWLAIRA